MTQSKIKTVALTGGPCSGKSTAISQIIEFVNSLGIRAVSVPEAATELKINGITFENFEDPVLFQRFIIGKILSNESFFMRALRHSKGVTKKGGLLICDRGLNDCLAYSDIESVKKVLSMDHGLNFKTEITSRYTMVIYMDVAPKEYYTTTNNDAREETYSEARVLGDKTVMAWVGHPNLILVGNDYGNFEGKVNTVIQNIAQLMGVPQPLAIERKYLVDQIKGFDRCIEKNNAVRVDIVQHYLEGDGQERVRAWTRDGVTTCFYTKKSNKPSIERIKTEEIISHKKYQQLLQRANPECAPIEKSRFYFIENNQYFRLDFFCDDACDCILEVQPSTIQTEIELPIYFNIVREVTDDPKYYNYNIAKQLAQQRKQQKRYKNDFDDCR